MSYSEFVNKKYDTFNRNYLLHFQALGRPEQGQDVEVDGVGGTPRKPDVQAATALKSFSDGIEVPSKKSPQGLWDRFTKAVSYPNDAADARQKAAWENVVAMTPMLWKPRKMGGAEYENGGFEAYVAARSLEGDMVYTSEEFDVSTRTYPDHEALSSSRFGRWGGSVNTMQKSWKDRYKVKLDDEIAAKVHIIAPRDNMNAARHMLLLNFARATMELDTHRGFGLREAVAYQSLSDAQKKKMGDAKYDDVAWFEIHQGVFITTDEEMFEKAKTVFAAEEYDKFARQPTLRERLVPSFG